MVEGKEKVGPKLTGTPCFNMIKVLYVNGSLMDRGGISTFMMNCYQNIDPEKVHIDFAVLDLGVGQRDKEIYERGGKIYNIVPKSQNPILHVKQLKKLLKNGRYDIVHSQADAANALVLKIAKKENVHVRISHSHNTAFLTTNKIHIFLNEIQKRFIARYATALWACSRVAGRWLYGNNKFSVIYNGINLKTFLYDSEMRYEKRKQLGIRPDVFAVVHIGKFDRQKNHLFILEIFNILKEIDSSIKLFLIGEGPLLEEIEKKASVKELSNIEFLRQRNDVSQLLNAFDCFILPSLFEGLSVAGIEAQVNGIKCIFSNTITDEIKLNNNVEFLSIDDARPWAERIVRIKRENADRVIPNNSIDQYDIYKIAKKIQDYYTNTANR